MTRHAVAHGVGHARQLDEKEATLAVLTLLQLGHLFLASIAQQRSVVDDPPDDPIAAAVPTHAPGRAVTVGPLAS